MFYYVHEFDLQWLVPRTIADRTVIPGAFQQTVMNVSGKTRYPRFLRRHADVMRWLIDNPGATLTECARALGYSRSWLSRVVNAPEFRERYEELARRRTRACLRASIRRILRPAN